MRINGLSASSYNTYSQCEFKFFLQQICGFEDTAGAAALQGTIAHKVLEILSRLCLVKHNKDSKYWDVGYLWEICFNRYFNEEPLVASQIQDQKLVKVCQGIHELVASPYTPIRDNTISAEAAFNIPFIEKEFRLKDSDKHFSVRGRIDRVDKINDTTIEIIDYKTGSRVDWESKDRHKKGPEDLFKDIQPRLYHMAGKVLYPWAENVLVTFIYIVDGGPVTVPFIDQDLKDTKEIIKKRFKTIQSNDDPQLNRGWKCKSLCPYMKNGVCDSVWEEKEEFGAKFVADKYTVLNVRKHRK